MKTKETRAELQHTISKLICEHNDSEAKELWEYVKDLAEKELKKMEIAKYEKQLRSYLNKQLKKAEWFPEYAKKYFLQSAGAVFFILDELINEDEVLWNYYNDIWEKEYHPRFIKLGALK